MKEDLLFDFYIGPFVRADYVQFSIN